MLTRKLSRRFLSRDERRFLAENPGFNLSSQFVDTTLVGRKVVTAYTIMVSQETEDIWFKLQSKLKDAIEMIDKTKK